MLEQTYDANQARLAQLANLPKESFASGTGTGGQRIHTAHFGGDLKEFRKNTNPHSPFGGTGSQRQNRKARMMAELAEQGGTQAMG